MRVLITGGAGFIGSHLADRCLKEGWTVSVIDDLSTGSLDNIRHLESRKRFSCAIDTVFNESLVSDLVDSADYVFHLAAAVGVKLVVDSTLQSIETNVHGTEVVLRAAAKKKRPVLIASTSEVYGKSSCFPLEEGADLVLGPTTTRRWSYACSKALDEFLGLAFWNEQSLPVTVARFFNTVGPRQTGRYGMVFPTFVRQALLGAPLTIFGTGAQQRCFGYVKDVVEALVRVACGSSMAGEVINIGNDSEISIRDLAMLIREVTHSSSNLQFIPYREAYGSGFEDVYRRVPSLRKLERLTGFRPNTPVTEIIEQVALDMRRRLKLERLAGEQFTTDTMARFPILSRT
ncbi:MAG: NAD-dependent epimerase/dehydratase family protein [Bryobacteraceae bacterium]|jgi:UDP-glucose 4-epimerase